MEEEVKEKYLSEDGIKKLREKDPEQDQLWRQKERKIISEYLKSTVPIQLFLQKK